MTLEGLLAFDPRIFRSADPPSTPEAPPGLAMAPIDDDEEQKRKPEMDRRPDKSVVVVSAILILAIALLLTMQQCSAANRDASSSNGGRRIADVPQSQRAAGAVSVWVKPGQDPAKVLKSYGIAAGSITVLEGDKAVGQCAPGQATQIVQRLKADVAVQDAGFVMSTGDTSAPLPPMATP